MIRSRTFYAFLLPAVVAGGVLFTAVSSRADDDDDDDSDVTIDSGDDADTSGTGTLSIATNPPVEVFLDGKQVGTTPLRMKVAAGNHKLKYVRPDGSKVTRAISVDAGGNVNLVDNFTSTGGGASASASAAAADQARAAADQARAAVDQARAQIDAAKASIANNPNVTPALRDKINKRLDKALKAVEKNLGKVHFNGDWDEFGRQMEAFGESMSGAFDGMDADFADLGKDIEAQVEAAVKHGLKHGLHGHGINIDVDTGNDDPWAVVIPPMPPVPPVPPMPPMPPMSGTNGTTTIDMSDMDMTIDLDSLNLSGAQRSSLRQVIADEQRVVQPAEEQLSQLSDQLRDALDDDDVDEATIGRYVDQMSEREAAIRKARLVAWAKSRRLLDDDQRKQVQRAARHHGP